MTIKAPIIMTGIAIGLLAIYGADVAASLGPAAEGFLPFDEKTRGFGLGIPSLVLPIAAYFISRNEKSKSLGIMIIIAGILIIVGGIAVIANSEGMNEENGRNIIAEAVPLLAIGAFIIGLGSIKLKKS